MTEQDLRDVLGRALPEQPIAATITRESAVASGRRALVRRRLQIQTTVVAAVVVAVVVTTIGPWRLAGHGVGVGASESPDGSPSAPRTLPTERSVTPTVTFPNTSPSPQNSTYPRMSPSPRTAALSQKLRAAAVAILPAATFSPVVVAFETGSYELAPFDVVDNGHGYFIGNAVIVNGSSAGMFAIAIWPAADDRKSPQVGCDSAYTPRLSCDTRTGPNGEKITIDTGVMQGGTATEYRVKVHRLDGVILMATANDGGPDPSGYQTPPPPQYHGVPMTPEQLVELLLTPGLNLGAASS